MEYNIEFFKKRYQDKKYTVEYEGKISLEYTIQELAKLHNILYQYKDISLTYTKDQIENLHKNSKEEQLIKITRYIDSHGVQVYNDSNIAMIDEIILNYLKEKILEKKTQETIKHNWDSIISNIKAQNIYEDEIKVHYYDDDLIFTGLVKERTKYNQLTTKQKTALQVYELRYIIQRYLPNAKKGDQIITDYKVPSQSCNLTDNEVEVIDYGHYGLALRKIMDYLVKQLNKNKNKSMKEILSDRNFVKQIVIHTEYKKHNNIINQYYSNIFGDNHTTDVANKRRRTEYVVPILEELKRLFIDNQILREYTPSGFNKPTVVGARVGAEIARTLVPRGGNKTRKQKRNGKKVKNTRKKKYKKKRTRRVRKK